MIRTKINWYSLSLLLTLILALAGCSGQAGQSASEVVTPETLNLSVDVDVTTVQDVRDRADVVVIDVREDWEYNSGHIPGAVWLPLGEIPNRLDEIPRDKTVIAVCRSGNRSSQATNFLRQQGFQNIHNMQGGMIAWDQAGYTIEK